MQKLSKYVFINHPLRNLSTFLFRDADNFSACLLICAPSTISVLQLSVQEGQGGGQKYILTTESASGEMLSL